MSDTRALLTTALHYANSDGAVEQIAEIERALILCDEADQILNAAIASQISRAADSNEESTT